METKETPAETWERCVEKALIDIGEEVDDFTYFEVAKLYHTERLKIEAPTDEELNEIAKKDTGRCTNSQLEFYFFGLRDMRKKITGV